MNNTILFHLESLASLKARAWALDKKEWELLKDVQKVIIEKGQVNDQIDSWQKEVDRLRLLDKASKIGFLLLVLLTGCSKESRPQPGVFFPSYPCVRCADGTLYCSDLAKPSHVEPDY